MNKFLENSFLSYYLKGIEISCPKCDEIGLVFTKWIKGPKLKPIFVVHLNSGEIDKICELTQEQADFVRSNKFEIENNIKTLLKTKKSFVLFSGGKDSLATVLYLKSLSKMNNDLTAIYIDTTAGIPESTKYVKEVCDYLKIKLEIVYPKIDYFTLAEKWGIPNYRKRWCCRELKIKPVAEFLKTVKEDKVVFDGIRAAESYIRKQYIPIMYLF